MKTLRFFTMFLLAPLYLMGQEAVIPVPDNLVTEGIPALPASLVNEVRNYTETRNASFISWHPELKEMLISTRFANSTQIHNVKMPGGSRTQITFFEEPVTFASYEPKNGSYFLFLKDTGGNEFSQIYRYDFSDKKITLLTDGLRSQNSGIVWNKTKELIAYTSTSRNGRDRDVYVMNPLDPASDRLVIENTGGGWRIADWSPDNKSLLLEDYISVNETRLYILNLITGEKSRLLPLTDERSTFSAAGFSRDGNGLYLISNSNSEFERLAYYDLAKKSLSFITTDINWDIEQADLSDDGSVLAFTTNENGLSKIYVLSTKDNTYRQLQGLPVGVISGVDWAGDSRSLGFTLATYNATSDVFEYDLSSQKLIRWTNSELGGMDVSGLKEPQLITWKSFDGRDISGYLYKASSKFTGKRPVMISIHGGPEGQARPGFLGRSNYFLNEMGISIIYPNVRGSTGYGKTFVDLDNGLKREESVKDIGALLSWIATQPDLDSDRILVTGGSYGGYMTLAVSFMYSDLIRCSIDIVGISDFNTFMKNTESYRRDLRRVEYGDERDPVIAEFFKKIAPLNHTSEIRKPLFIVQGGNDPRVPYTESLQMKEKVKQNGGTVWFLMANDEGHGFRKKNNIDFQFYATIEFVRQHLLD